VPSAVQPAAEAQAVPEQAQAKPQPVVADLETILQERDACGVSLRMKLKQRGHRSPSSGSDSQQ
jgi:hypothetical protein